MTIDNTSGKRPASTNVVITGFMGVGKTTIGRMVAERLGRRFVDIDELIEARASLDIPDIFRQLGEAAFRQLEAQACQEMAQEQDLVIATGGGALVNAENLRAMEQTGVVICLDVDLDTLWQRVSQHDVDRPMLWGDSGRERLHQLSLEREAAYRRIAHHVDIGRSKPERIADRIILILNKLGIDKNVLDT